MRTLWVHREIAAPAETVWELLTNVECWPVWGPTVRHAEINGDSFELGTTGVVTTAIGVELPFEITEYRAGSRWTWNVAGVPATHHMVEPIDSGRSRAGFGVPWPVAPYLSVCFLALRRLESTASETTRYS